MKIAVVIPNWNGKDRLKNCLDAVSSQTLKPLIIVVDNGSTDGSLEYIEKNYPKVDIVRHLDNLGFAGGVNSGIKRAKKLGMTYIALLNNDAIPDNNWLKELYGTLNSDKKLGSVACLMVSGDGEKIDSTGDFYTTWGLTFARQRDEPLQRALQKEDYVFGASAGAALYRIEALEDVGMFDEDFFAYYEDTDLNFRLQLAGWRSKYNPRAVVLHEKGSTSSKIKGFTTFQTFKNLPLLFWKNVPLKLLPKMFVRFHFAYLIIFLSSLISGNGWPAIKGVFRMVLLIPNKLYTRRKIQKSREVTPEYIDSVLVHDLPPSAERLRRLRSYITFGKK